MKPFLLDFFVLIVRVTAFFLFIATIVMLNTLNLKSGGFHKERSCTAKGCFSENCAIFNTIMNGAVHTQ